MVQKKMAGRPCFCSRGATRVRCSRKPSSKVNKTAGRPRAEDRTAPPPRAPCDASPSRPARRRWHKSP